MLRPGLLQFRVKAVFAGMMYGIGVTDHVGHDIVHELDVHLLVVVDAVRLALEDGEAQAHIAVIRMQLGEDRPYVLRHTDLLSLAKIPILDAGGRPWNEGICLPCGRVMASAERPADQIEGVVTIPKRTRNRLVKALC